MHHATTVGAYRALLLAAGAVIVTSSATLPRLAHAETAAATAKTHYKKARTLYQLGDYREALREYKEAYTAKQDPAFLFNVAQCHRQLKEYPEAVRMYGSYLRDAPRAANRVEVEELIAELRRTIEQEETARAQAAAASPPTTAPAAAAPAAAASTPAEAPAVPAPAAAPVALPLPVAPVSSVPSGGVFVRTVPPGARVFLDGLPVGTSPGVFPSAVPGRHFVHVELDGHPSKDVEVEVPASGIRTVDVAMESEQRYSNWFIGAGAFVLFGSPYMKSKVSYVQSTLGGPSYSEDLRLAAKSASGLDLHLAYAFGGSHALGLSIRRGWGSVKSDGGTGSFGELGFDVSFYSTGISYQYLFRRGALLRPTAGLLAGFVMFKIRGEAASKFDPSDPARPFSDPQVGLMLDLRNVWLHAYARFDVLAIAIGNIPMMTAGALLGGAF